VFLYSPPEATIVAASSAVLGIVVAEPPLRV
jgi:hypothetical protein